ncbi:MAG TPA: PD-(D/E)XK nuclease family protein, partial [Steroidobacteraceae bacterium]|nr:PD-(D/E)XK nuclease family protein [Steroidobacteraceae bacterium]
VPLALQRAAGMSALQPTLLLEQSRQLLARLRAATAQLMLSWATRSEGREQLPSALLAPLRHAPASVLTVQQPSLSRQIRLAREIEHYQEPPGQPWPLERPLPGGTRAIDHQSRCPFRAYAELRLACTPLEAHLIGPDPRERGQFLHRALELLWQQLGDSRQLAAQQAGGTLDGLIEACVHAAARHTWADETERVSARARAREERRGRQLLRELAALELTREPFSVAGLEQRSRITLEGALLELRIDRIDRLADDSYVVFDYKTGRVGVLDWQAERPSDPQLLVYLLAQPAAVSALALVRLSPHHVSYQGAADLPSRLPKLSQSRARAPEGAEPSDETGAWLRQTARWRTSITRLARDFIGGAAPVDPLPQACRLCHLHAVCRIGDLRPSGDTQEEPGDG